jgi:transposase
LHRMQFGNRSEKRAQEIEQLELWVAQLEKAVTQRSSVLAEQARVPTAASIPKPRRDFPAHLPRETQTIAPQESCCPDCGGELKHLGEDVSEMLELEPVRFKVIRHVRPKLACASCDTIVQAPAPTRPIERGMAGPGLLAHVLAGKYGDHLPLYRQAEIYAREGVDLDRTLLAQWVASATALLTPLTDALRAHVLAADLCTPTIRRFRCSRPGAARPRPVGFGRMCATRGQQPARLRRRSGLPSAPIARASIHSNIYKTSAAFCKSTGMQASRKSTTAAGCSKRRVGRTFGASSSISMNCTNLR